MAGRKSDFSLPMLDDLFSTQEQREEAKLSKIRDIPITEIDDFPDHPFKVRDDEDMIQLVESILHRKSSKAFTKQWSRLDLRKEIYLNLLVVSVTSSVFGKKSD